MSRLHNNSSDEEVNNKNVIGRLGQWDRAIAEANAQLAELKVRSARLKAAIKVFSESRDQEKANASTHK